MNWIKAAVTMRIDSAQSYYEIRDSLSHDLVSFLVNQGILPYLIQIPQFLWRFSTQRQRRKEFSNMSSQFRTYRIYFPIYSNHFSFYRQGILLKPE